MPFARNSPEPIDGAKSNPRLSAGEDASRSAMPLVAMLGRKEGTNRHRDNQGLNQQ